MKIMKKAFCALLLAAALPGCDFTLLPPGNVVSLHLSDLSFVPVPVPGEEPVERAETEEYDCAVAWKKNGGAAVSESFQEGVNYSAEVLLTPKKSYTFQGFNGVFFHRKADIASQAVKKDFAEAVIEFGRQPFPDANFTSLSGTRLKTFTMSPDPSRLDEILHAYLRASGSVQWMSPGMGGGTETEAYSNEMNVDFPLRALLSDGYRTVTGSGKIFYADTSNGLTSYYSGFNGSASLYFSNARNLDYPGYALESFNCGSYVLPKTGYELDRGALESKPFSFSFSLSADQSRQLSGLAASSYRHLALTASPYAQVVFRPSESRDFFLYRSVSVSYAPEIAVIGWQGGPLVDRFVFDEASNTLTAYLKEYMNHTPGDVFFFYIIADNGSVHKKTVSIGN